ncbi:hypothetical protein Thein_1979 [Thermodesulfatator indicus DSM 15286]|uniref:Helix-turn-helix domain-containing protein n=1 Tax=Thermodesulfatator indicus (strain DSM 15286 / JCM 11887 / CIR29812) TaxID=667014 RepID=F8ACQ4_THEID|nr:helix-turn-helix domain-containing protein [Thermodesulfatator indicus]AEH45833.1 hypothetical protein Thein_1979 [Thermodesulfatator indicus DSM 15286]
MKEQQIIELLQELREEIARLQTWPRWLPIRDAVRYSGLSEKKLRELAREGEIYATKPGGGKLIFDRESIDDYFLREKARIKAHLELFKRSGIC